MLCQRQIKATVWIRLECEIRSRLKTGLDDKTASSPIREASYELGASIRNPGLEPAQYTVSRSAKPSSAPAFMALA